jgi:ABA4-like protein
MTAESLFSICSMLVLPGWVLLVFLPRWPWTQKIAAGIVPLILAIAYLVLIVTNFRKSQGGFGSLQQVSQLFQNPYNLLAGWVHYLAFDLFTGAWEVRDAARLRIAHALVIPCLVLTFLFGPIGLLTWFLIRSSLRGLTEVK